MLYYYIVAANIVVIAHPGQEVELICNLSQTSGNIGWEIDHTLPYGVNHLYNGILDGYSADIKTNGLIILNIMMNDSRNETEYHCGIISGPVLQQKSDVITLYVTGEFQ